MLRNMFDYSSPVSSYYASGSDRVDDTYYTRYTPQHAPATATAERYSTDDWPTSSPDYATTATAARDPRERREPFEERTRTIRPDDYYDDRNRLYRTEDRYSGRSTRSARSDQDHNWYQSDTTRSSGQNYSTIRRYPAAESSTYRTDSESSGKEVFEGGNDRTLRAEERDWYFEHTTKPSAGKVETSRSRVNSGDKVNEVYNNKLNEPHLEHSVTNEPMSVNSAQVGGGLQKNLDNTCCGFLGNPDATNNRPVGGLVASYGVLDKNKGVVVGVAGPRSEAPGDCWRGCCKPAIFTLLLMLLLLVFALVAGLLLYFNCK